MAEAIRLATIIDKLLPNEPEILGLLSLMHFHGARTAARIDDEGAPVMLDEQDRSLWDQHEIETAQVYIGRAMLREHPGPFQIQAAISACHMQAELAQDTDWDQISALYASLRAFIDTPVVQLNHAVAVAKATDAATGLSIIDDIPGLDGYVYYHAAKGALLLELNDEAGAAVAYAAAMDVATGDHQRSFIASKLQHLPTPT